MSYQVDTFLEGLQVFVSLAFLLYASWSDLKTREVSNMVWALFAPIGLTLTLTQLIFFEANPNDSLYWFGISVGITSALAAALFYAGAYGGADAKALICLSLTLPMYPTNFVQEALFRLSAALPFIPANFFQLPFAPFIFPLSVFSNAVIIAALSVLYVLLRNLLWRQRARRKLFEGLENESAGRKLLALLSGYKIPLDKLEESEFLYPLEDVQVSETGETKRKLLVFPKDEQRESIVERIVTATKKGTSIDWVWATPGLPMLVFITAGLITALILGDFVWIILSRML
jgi:preflagellin peptidase FlaK